jgi:hypothetical protein
MGDGGVHAVSWSPAGVLPAAASWWGPDENAVTLPGGRVLVVGGSDPDQNAIGAVSVFDPSTLAWSALDPLSATRRLHTVTRLNDGRILVAGGTSGPFAYPIPPVATAQIFEPRTETWSRVPEMIEPRYFHSATLLADGRVLVAGGGAIRSASTICGLATAEIFDPVTEAWTATKPMVDQRIQHVAVRLPDGRVLAVGGTLRTGRVSYTGNALCEIYDPDTDTWTPTGTMRDARQTHQATLLADGTVLATGGNCPNLITGPVYDPHSLSTVERYNPTSGQWTPVANLPWSRSAHRAVLLRNGKLLVFGGTDDANFDAGFASTILYDPLGQTWTATGGMHIGRTGAAVATLTDGRVLAAGGLAVAGNATNEDPATPALTAELYTAS